MQAVQSATDTHAPAWCGAAQQCCSAALPHSCYTAAHLPANTTCSNVVPQLMPTAYFIAHKGMNRS